jgi:SAM-dependent methyltransferase
MRAGVSCDQRPAEERRDAALEMHCPYCLGELERGPRVEAGFGARKCGCGEHPVLDGIVCFADERGLAFSASRWAGAMERVHAGDEDGALAAPLSLSVRTRAGRVCSLLQKAGLRTPAALERRARTDALRGVRDESQTFAQAVSRLRNQSYGAYLVHRFINPSIVVASAMIAVLRKLDVRRPRVLDLGGGAGHASYLISLVRPDARVVLADQDFTNLYLARRYLAPGAECVCLDAEARLPFADGGFDVIFSMDALHYVRGKAGLAEELRRVAKPGAVWMLAHLHNGLSPNPAAGLPLSPGGYARLFHGRWFGEGELLEGLMRLGVIDLRAEHTESRLAAANALYAVAGPEWLWERHEVRSAYSGARHGLNPTYVPEGEAAVARRYPSAALAAECAAMDAYLPERVQLGAPVLERLAAGVIGTDEGLAALREKMVAIPLPERYC